MTGHTHFIASATLGMVLSYQYQIEPIYVIPCVIGGLFADSDHPYSLMGRILPLWKFQRFQPHRRNPTHTLKGACWFSVPWCWDLRLALFFFTGYLSHLLLDMMNPTGVPLWWPDKRMMRIALIRTGSKQEYLALFIFYLFLLAMVAH